MKKIKSQLSLGLVCIILGLMLSFQLKSTFNKINVTRSSEIKDITKQMDDLKKQKDDLNAKLMDYQKKIDDFEIAAANQSDTTKLMKDEIDRLRFSSGLVDVEGVGIVITITPITDISTRMTAPIDSSDIIDIVNDLNSAGSEAISINDERYVGRTQISSVGGSIKINDTKFSSTEPFVVKAIGAPDILNGVFKLPGSVVENLRNAGIDVKINEDSNIKILKYNKNLDFKYMKKIGR